LGKYSKERLKKVRLTTKHRWRRTMPSKPGGQPRMLGYRETQRLHALALKQPKLLGVVGQVLLLVAFSLMMVALLVLSRT
jgi:hypothetical protein